MNDATPSSISYDHLTNPFQPSDDSINDALLRINVPLEPILTNCTTLVRKARYHFLFAMYSNLVYVSVIIFLFFSHRYSATTRTRHLEGDYPITTFFF